MAMEHHQQGPVAPCSLAKCLQNCIKIHDKKANEYINANSLEMTYDQLRAECDKIWPE